MKIDATHCATAIEYREPATFVATGLEWRRRNGWGRVVDQSVGYAPSYNPSQNERDNSVPVIFPHGHGGAAAEHILVGTARSRHTNGADERDAVDNRQGATDGHDVPMVRDDQPAHPGLACLRHKHRCREVKGSGGVRF